MPNINKEKISDEVKKKVWLKYNYFNDIRFTQCCTCESLVMIPESIRKFYNCNYDILNIYVENKKKNLVGVGEFGHLVSEKNGGKATENNLIVQCKTCNTSNGSNDIEFKEINNRDSLMIDINIDEDIKMGSNNINCCEVLKNGLFCKNLCLKNRNKCFIHLND